MNFSAQRNNKDKDDDNTSSDSNLPNDKLQKAIARNRMKMAKKKDSPPSFEKENVGEEIRRTRLERPEMRSRRREVFSQARQASLRNEQSLSQVSNIEGRKRPSLNPKMRSHINSSPVTRRVSNNFTSNKVINSQEIQRTSDFTQKEPVLNERVSREYGEIKSTNKPLSRISMVLIKILWCFCIFLLGRLMVVEGGVFEYHEKTVFLDRMVIELKALKGENKELIGELRSISTEEGYQKKLVRHHLGHIAKDEYLILFSKVQKKKR